MRFIIILLFFLSSCAKIVEDVVHVQQDSPQPKITPTLDERLRDQVESFELKYNRTVIGKYAITIGDVESDFVGICYKYFYGDDLVDRQVIVDETFYNDRASDFFAIEQLVWHELGHCELNLDHDDSFVNANIGGPFIINIEKTIMNSHAFGHNGYYQTFNDYYHDQLFDQNVKIDDY